MTPPRQWTVGIGVVMALVFGTALVIKIRPQIDLLGVGSTAPTFHATDLRTGRPTTLAHYRGKVVLLNIWATWCEPCRVEMPSMERIYRRLGEGGDFRIEIGRASCRERVVGGGVAGLTNKRMMRTIER